jgi:ATP-dependent DNA helicase RecG
VTTAETGEQRSASLLGLPGIGESRAAAYGAAGLLERSDLLYHLPNRYRRRPAPVTARELVDGQLAAVWGRVTRASVRRRGRHATVSVLLEDEAGDELLVLLFNRAYLAKSLKKGSRLWAAGKAEVPEQGRPRLLAADHEAHAEDAEPPEERLLPIYRLPAGVPPAVHRKVLALVLDQVDLEDWRKPARGEPSLAEAMRALHLPVDIQAVRAARLRLARDEAFALSLDVAARRREEDDEQGVALPLDEANHADLMAHLPHVPTGAQARVIDELRRDLSSDRPMTRLLQGDVGSGKTMVALYALLAALGSGRQGALMAPTEVLARQHAEELRGLLAETYGDRAPEVALVVGGGRAAERRRLREGLALGTIPLAVGTHGLASGSVAFADLAVAVIDEQHRFGVRQRVRLATKGRASHLLVMTATPIPRTLALTAYGELDVSILDELPPGRSPRTTLYVPAGKQPALWRRLRAEVDAGHRGYVVCPSIAAGEEDGHSVEETHAAVCERLGPEVRVGAVHGRLPGPERDEVLDAFRGGALDVLVATVLVEVGLDVPEATFVVVPDPSRFGLATLHQIRGRVGRGAVAGSCYLLGPLKGEASRERARALCASEDGFALAEQDLELRGPGEVLGTRQSGMPGFLVLDPVRDVELLASARALAFDKAKNLDAEALAALRDRAFPRLTLVTENLLAGG